MVNLSFADPVMRPAAVVPPAAPNEPASLTHHLNNARVIYTAQNGHGPAPVPRNAAVRGRSVGDDALCLGGGIHRSAGPLARGRVR